MFECNNILNNWKESKTSNYEQLEKLIGTYLHMYNVTRLNLSRSRYQKKNVKTLRNLLNFLSILSCALPILF